MKSINVESNKYTCVSCFFILILFIVAIAAFPYGTIIAGIAAYIYSHYDSKARKKMADEKERYRKKMADEYERYLQSLPKWKQQGFSSELEYLATIERELRKVEQVEEEQQLLALAYKRRTQYPNFKQNLISLDSLFDLSPIEFERWVKHFIFEKEGWRVVETKITGDGGIDLILYMNDEYSIAQCKRFRKTVPESCIRDFYGTMISEGVSRGYFVTTGLFSLPAQRFAKNKPIEMIDRRVLSQKYL